MPDATEQYKKGHESGKLVEPYNQFREIIPRNNRVLGRKMVGALKEKTPPVISVLDIGGGDGRALFQMIDEVGLILKASYYKRGIKFLVDYIDVSEGQKRAFEKNICSLYFPKEICEIQRAEAKSWIEFEPQRKYDLIVALHSWYGIGKEETPLKKVVNSLSSDGAAYILLAKGGSLFGALGKRLLGRIASEDITDALKKAGIKHDCKGMNTNIFDINDLFTDGMLTQNGEAAVSYILMQDYKTIPKKQKEDIRKIFKSQLKNPEYKMDDLIIVPGVKG